MAYISELRIFAFNFPPKGWLVCNGQLLPVAKNQALFSLLGKTYGGDGVNTFGLPNLMGRVPVHVNDQYALGQSGGEAAHVLTMKEIPAHNHNAMGCSLPPNVNSPANAICASNTGVTPYGNPANGIKTMAPGALATVGANLGHENMAPYLSLMICICIQGIYPTRN